MKDIDKEIQSHPNREHYPFMMRAYNEGYLNGEWAERVLAKLNEIPKHCPTCGHRVESFRDVSTEGNK